MNIYSLLIIYHTTDHPPPSPTPNQQKTWKFPFEQQIIMKNKPHVAFVFNKIQDNVHLLPSCFVFFSNWQSNIRDITYIYLVIIYTHFYILLCCLIRHRDIISRYENNCDNNIDFLNCLFFKFFLLFLQL